MQLKSHETVQLDSNLWPMESTLWNMNYEGEKFSEKYPNPRLKCVSQKPYTCLGDSMWQGPKKLSSRATWADWTHWNKTVIPRKKMVGFIPPSWPIYTYIGHSILWVFWEDGEKRKKEKKRKSDKNKIDLISILFRRLCYIWFFV